MASSPSNLSELTVTCRQCGSASMERIGDREYRCTHCGAITVVSQDGTKSAPPPAAPYLRPDPTSPNTSTDISDTSDSGRVLTSGEDRVATMLGRHAGISLIVIALVLWFVFVILMHACGSPASTSGSISSSSSSSQPSTPPTPTVRASLLSLTPVQWSTEAKGESGHYTGMVTNHSNAAITVPSFSMALYLRGARVDSADSTVPVATLLPGEYEPIAFAFKSPSDDPHPEITPPTTADVAPGKPVRLQFNDRQLVQESGKLGYRMVGIVDNKTTTPAKEIVVAVMLFNSAHALISYGSYKVNRSLRAGERTAIEVDIPTTNVNPIASYEYLVDAQPDN